MHCNLYLSPPPVNAHKKKRPFIKTKTKVNIEMYLTCNGYTFNCRYSFTLCNLNVYKMGFKKHIKISRRFDIIKVNK